MDVTIKAETHRPNRWMSEAFGEIRTRSGTNMFGVFSCVRSGAARTLSALIEHAKSEMEGSRVSKPLDSLTGCVPAEWPFLLVVC